jgi:uncharacterized membrane protein
MGWGGWGSGILGWIVPLLFWGALLVALIVGIFWLARRLGGTSPGTASTETPLAIARRRLAAGEISVDEYDEVMHRLQAESALDR